MRADGVNICLTAHKRGACLYAYGFRGEASCAPARTRSDEKEGDRVANESSVQCIVGNKKQKQDSDP